MEEKGVKMEDLVRNAIREANKLGARGLQVVDYIEPQNATDDPDFILVAQMPGEETAGDMPWYE